MQVDIRDRVEDALKGHDARYIEIRVEEVQGTHIRYRGRDLDEIGRTRGVGGCVRALAGGWGFASFNGLDDLWERVAAAVRNARLVAGAGIDLAPVEPVVDIVPPLVKKDPLGVSLQDKKAALDQYVDIIWEVSQMTTSTVGYGDSHRKRIFASSAGSYIQQ